MTKDKVINIVCEVCEITIEQLLSKRKTRDISDARKIIAFILLDEGLCYSFENTGKSIGLAKSATHKAIMYFHDYVKLDRNFRFLYEKSKNAILSAKTSAN